MMNRLKAGVSGKFILSDPVTKEVIAEFSNDISDYGMQRLAGYNAHNAYAIAENFEFLHLGEGPDPVSRNAIYKLVSPLIPGTNMTVVQGDVADALEVDPPTRTEYDRTPSGNLITRFINNWDVTFITGVTVREIGVAHVDYRGSSRSRGGYNGGGPTDNPARVDLGDDINTSLFSRAPLPLSISYIPGASVRVTYICEIVLEYESEWASSLVLDTSTLATVDPADLFPNTKINIRQKPFYELGRNGKAVNYFLANGNAPDTGVKTCPILDSLSDPQRGYWVLDMFLPSGGGVTYSSFVNTITASQVVGGTAIPSPITSERTIKINGTPIPQTHKNRYYPVISKDHPSTDVWSKKLRFTMRSQDLPDVSGVTIWTLWRAYDLNQQINLSWKGLNGLTLILENGYLPTANKVFGLDFTITWTRGI